jgi:hypothetical protein
LGEWSYHKRDKGNTAGSPNQEKIFSMTRETSSPVPLSQTDGYVIDAYEVLGTERQIADTEFYTPVEKSIMT